MAQAQQITPFLWFDDQAEEAARFYVSIFGSSEILRVDRDGDAGPFPAGSGMTVACRLAGQEFTAPKGGPEFRFTKAVSCVVDCGSQAEVDRYWER